MKTKNYTRIKICLIGYLLSLYVGAIGVCFERQCLAEPQIVSPVVASSQLPIVVDGSLAGTLVPPTSAVGTPSPELGETPERERGLEVKSKHYEVIKEEIEEVFGKHAEKAMKVLSCENSSLNPEAVNTAGNSPAGSRDIGVFQINEYWQGVNGKFLFDPEINIRVAWRIYEDNGYSFERWTCGRKFGI